jgi:myo-inositol-1(or 4)-monophosphatase
MFGSAAVDLARVAEGRLDASLTLSNRSWDVTAGVILAREAGAQVVDLHGHEHTAESAAAIAMSPWLKPELLVALNSIY